MFPTRRIERAAEPWPFRRSSATIRYAYGGSRFSPADYLSRNPVTGLLILKGNDILCEHYQYGRTDRDRLISRSMVKSTVGLLIGIAVSEGAIRSVEDTADVYVSELKGTEYGKTPIRDLLHMSSGVEFGEEADNGRDLDRLWLDLMGGYVSRYAAPGRADPMFGYGYPMWLLPGATRRFALLGDYGQRICVEPASRLVLVQTAVDQGPEIWSLWSDLVEQFGGRRE